MVEVEIYHPSFCFNSSITIKVIVYVDTSGSSVSENKLADTVVECSLNILLILLLVDLLGLQVESVL